MDLWSYQERRLPQLHAMFIRQLIEEDLLGIRRLPFETYRSSLGSRRTSRRDHRKEVVRSAPLTSPIPLRSTDGIPHSSCQVNGREMTWYGKSGS